jgi:hypothetical protein
MKLPKKAAVPNPIIRLPSEPVTLTARYFHDRPHMDNSALAQAIEKAIRELEVSGDLIITTTIPSKIVESIANAVYEVSPHLLSATEYNAIIAAASLSWSGFYVEDWDFQTHVGVTREELHLALKKLRRVE